MSVRSPHVCSPERELLHHGNRMLSQEVARARLALGQRMFAVAIDDGQTGARIAALNQSISRTISRAELETLTAERDRLFVGLADAALADHAPLPGADLEYDHVRQLLEAQRVDATRPLLENSPTLA